MNIFINLILVIYFSSALYIFLRNREYILNYQTDKKFNYYPTIVWSVLWLPILILILLDELKLNLLS